VPRGLWGETRTTPVAGIAVETAGNFSRAGLDPIGAMVAFAYFEPATAFATAQTKIKKFIA